MELFLFALIPVLVYVLLGIGFMYFGYRLLRNLIILYKRG